VTVFPLFLILSGAQFFPVEEQVKPVVEGERFDSPVRASDLALEPTSSASLDNESPQTAAHMGSGSLVPRLAPPAPLLPFMGPAQYASACTLMARY
jgi:hypothetical protein